MDIAPEAAPIDYTLRDVASKLLVCRGVDSEISSLLKQLSESDGVGLSLELQAAIFQAQKLRMKFIGEYMPAVVGSRRFTANTMISFPSKEQ